MNRRDTPDVGQKSDASRCSFVQSPYVQWPQLSTRKLGIVWGFWNIKYYLFVPLSSGLLLFLFSFTLLLVDLLLLPRSISATRLKSVAFRTLTSVFEYISTTANEKNHLFQPTYTI